MKEFVVYQSIPTSEEDCTCAERITLDRTDVHFDVLSQEKDWLAVHVDTPDGQMLIGVCLVSDYVEARIEQLREKYGQYIFGIYQDLGSDKIEFRDKERGYYLYCDEYGNLSDYHPYQRDNSDIFVFETTNPLFVKVFKGDVEIKTKQEIVNGKISDVRTGTNFLCRYIEKGE